MLGGCVISTAGWPLLGCSEKPPAAHAGPAQVGRRMAADLPIGVQVWSIREQLQADVAGTLKRMADIGFREIEFFDIATTEPAMQRCQGMSLNLVGLHFWEIFEEEGSWGKWIAAGSPTQIPSFDPDVLAKQAARYGFRYLVYSGGAPEEACKDVFAAESYCNVINRVGRSLRERGFRFLYHAEMLEFSDLGGGRTLFDLLIERTDPADVGFEADVFWLTHVGRDPVATLRQLGARAEILHLKDRKRGMPPARPQDGFPDDKRLFVPVGAGSIDFIAVLQTAREVGVKHLFVEQDESAGDVIADLGQSYRYLRSVMAST
jgi:sugar phosphate isomerase/epimerase